jgi:hypothetical protein
MKERLDTLLALAGSLSGQSKDLTERAKRISQEEESIRRSIAAERARPLRIGSAIARLRRQRDSLDLQVCLVTGFHLGSDADPLKARVYVDYKWAAKNYREVVIENDNFDIGEGGFILIDPKEARERLHSPLFLLAIDAALEDMPE